ELMFSGRFMSDDADTNLSGKEFAVEATISWETLTIKGFQCSKRYWSFGRSQASRSKTSPPSLVAHARRLGDVLIDEGLNWPIFRGRFAFAPEPAYPPRSQDSSDGKFLHMHFDDEPTDMLRFSNASNVVVHDSGFAGASALTRFLSLNLFGRNVLE